MSNPIVKIKTGDISNLYANNEYVSNSNHLEPLEDGELAYNRNNNGLYIGYNGRNYLISAAFSDVENPSQNNDYQYFHGLADSAKNANIAAKLGTVDKGDTNTPIWIDNGEPKAVTGLDLDTTGNAATATQWKTARDFSISGTASNTITHSVNGTKNITLTLPKTLSGFTSLSADAFTGGVWNGTTVAVAYGGTGATTAANARTNLGVPPTSHASSATTYGVATGTNYGHVKLSDATNSSSAASDGIAASPKAVKSVYDYAATKIDSTTASIELNHTGRLLNYGGFIDFHYFDAEGKPRNSANEVVSATPDYTSRIIESSPGLISVNGVSFKGSSITSGTWNGSAIVVGYGGTGKTSHTTNAVLVGNNTNNIKNIASASGAFYATSANGEPQFGTLPVAQGGTGATTLTSGAALIGNGTGAIATRSITNNTTAGSSVTASTNLITANTLANWNGAYDGSGNSRITKLGTISKGVWNGTTIAIAYGGTGLTSNPSMLVNLSSTSADNVLKASPRPGVTGTLPVANGGTGATTFSTGQALIGNGANAVSTRAILNNTSKGPSGWTSQTDSTQLINHNTLAYWNGAYNNTNSNLSVLGTITTGIWNGTTIAVAYGGTGNTSQTANRLIYSENASKLSSSGHYASSTKVAINSTTAPTEALYVNGDFKTYGNAYVNNGFISITRDGNPYIGLSDGTNNWYYQSVKDENKVGLGPTWTKATKWDVNGNVSMPASLSVTSNLSIGGTATVTGLITGSGGLYVSGRAAGGGDDEGIVVAPASNSYAGITLGAASGVRTTLYLMPSTSTHRSVWRHHNGTSQSDITHPEVSGEVVVHTADTAQGSATLPVYVADSGVVTPCTASSVFSAFTSSTNTLSITVAGQTRTASIVNSISNTWANGTTSGPTLKTTVNGVAGTAVAIPSASGSISGVVTTGAQTFAGSKTFSSVINMNAGMNWAPNQNITCAPTAANQEWSFDVGSTSYAGSYWHVWSSVKSASILACYADDRRVDIPLHLSVGGYENSAYAISTNSFISNSWIRTVGNTGWYSETHGGGIYMTDSSWVQVYNNKNFKITGQLFAYSYGNQGNNAPAIIFDKPGGNFTGIGANSESDTIFFGPVDSNYAWVSGYDQRWKFQGSLAVTTDINMQGAGQIIRPGYSSSWIAGRSNALLRSSTYNGYNPVWSTKTTNGEWTCGPYTSDILYFTYTTDTDFNAGTNNTTAQIQMKSDGTLLAPKLQTTNHGTANPSGSAGTGTLYFKRI